MYYTLRMSLKCKLKYVFLQSLNPSHTVSFWEDNTFRTYSLSLWTIVLITKDSWYPGPHNLVSVDFYKEQARQKRLNWLTKQMILFSAFWDLDKQRKHRKIPFSFHASSSDCLISVWRVYLKCYIIIYQYFIKPDA